MTTCEIVAGDRVQYAASLRAESPIYMGAKFLIVGDIFWRGQRRVLGIRDGYDKTYELIPALMEVINEN